MKDVLDKFDNFLKGKNLVFECIVIGGAALMIRVKFLRNKKISDREVKLIERLIKNIIMNLQNGIASVLRKIEKFGDSECKQVGLRNYKLEIAKNEGYLIHFKLVNY